MTGGAAVLQIPRTPGVGVRFHHTDAKLADFTNAAVVWINDAVWSVATRSAVYARLAADLRLGALVVDYHDSLVTAGTPSLVFNRKALADNPARGPESSGVCLRAQCRTLRSR